MIEKEPGCILLTATGQEYTKSCRIIGILWRGATTAGDQVTIKGRNGSKQAVLWLARTDSTNTYLGAIWGPPGIHAPDGFTSTELASGEVGVYLSE